MNWAGFAPPLASHWPLPPVPALPLVHRAVTQKIYAALRAVIGRRFTRPALPLVRVFPALRSHWLARQGAWPGAARREAREGKRLRARNFGGKFGKNGAGNAGKGLGKAPDGSRLLLRGFLGGFRLAFGRNPRVQGGSRRFREGAWRWGGLGGP